MDEARGRSIAAVNACPEWFHSIEVAPGIVTPGRKSAAALEAELRSLRLPDLRGKSVLDIGAYDGFFSFAAERLGASRVTALDHYVWSTDMAEYMKEWRTSRHSVTPLPPPHESRHWRPQDLPGRRPFDAARQALGSLVQPVAGDFMTMDLARLGSFDIVLYLGVLYHMEDPLGAVRRVASVTIPGGLAIIETEAMELVGLESKPYCEFFPGRELNNDASNWWSPNATALEGLCTAAGFREVTVLTKRPWTPLRARLAAALNHLVHVSGIRQKLGWEDRYSLPKMRYRALAHARR